AYKEEVKPILQQKGKVLARRVFNNEKVTDHHAIIPTEEKVHLGDLSSEERKIYDLIVRRFLTLFYPQYKYETISVVIEANGETLTTKTKVVTELGFKKVMNLKDDDIEKSSLQQLSQGQTLTVKKVDVEEK